MRLFFVSLLLACLGRSALVGTSSSPRIGGREAEREEHHDQSNGGDKPGSSLARGSSASSAQRKTRRRRRRRLVPPSAQDPIVVDVDRELVRRNYSGCVGSKLEVVVRFDIFPEDFSMELKNDDDDRRNRPPVWPLGDPVHDYSAPSYRFATVQAGVCLPRNRCWVLTVYDKYGDG
jgi:hypothetical protein